MGSRSADAAVTVRTNNTVSAQICRHIEHLSRQCRLFYIRGRAIAALTQRFS
jgi:hypothetical protein